MPVACGGNERCVSEHGVFGVGVVLSDLLAQIINAWPVDSVLLNQVHTLGHGPVRIRRRIGPGCFL